MIKLNRNQKRETAISNHISLANISFSTPNFRLVKKVVVEGILICNGQVTRYPQEYELVLQQAWVNQSDGKVEWKDVTHET